jgi:hypothetical protein
MSCVGRMGGALLAETQGRYFLVGHPKGPIDFAAAGFLAPPGIDAGEHRFVELRATRPIDIRPPCLTMRLEGDPLVSTLVSRLLVERNGSVSERLWGLICEPYDHVSGEQAPIDAAWLGDLPASIWQVVRDAVLKCT